MSWEIIAEVGRVSVFEVHTVPVVWGRPRRNGNRWFVPSAQLKCRQEVANAFEDSHHASFGKSLIRVTVETRFRRPKKPSAYAPTRCDVDNLAKGVLDALNTVAWEDDRQIVELICRKRYCSKGEHEGYRVEIAEIAKIA